MGLMTVLPHRAVIGIQYDEMYKEFGIEFGVVPGTQKVLNKYFYQHGSGPSFGNFFLSP